MIVLNELDPCGTAAQLKTIYANLIAGQASISIAFRAGPNGVQRETTFHKAEPDRLQALVREYEGKCAQLSGGRPRRFGMRAGGRI
jgi:hypothetical protein